MQTFLQKIWTSVLVFYMFNSEIIVGIFFFFTFLIHYEKDESVLPHTA